MADKIQDAQLNTEFQINKNSSHISMSHIFHRAYFWKENHLFTQNSELIRPPITYLATQYLKPTVLEFEIHSSFSLWIVLIPLVGSELWMAPSGWKLLATSLPSSPSPTSAGEDQTPGNQHLRACAEEPNHTPWAGWGERPGSEWSSTKFLSAF